MAAMLELEEAQERLLALASLMPAEQIPAEESLGRYLARDLKAARTQPARDLSAMDGYAIGDGPGPWNLVGESRAGSAYDGTLGANETIRISTGAALPEETDRILIQENAAVENGLVSISCDAPGPGRHVRKRGIDFVEGDTILNTGSKIRPAQLALAISAGHKYLEVRQAPRIAVLDSGDELAVDPTQCSADQIPASNGVMLSAMFAELGCDVRRIGPVPDSMDAFREALRQADGADVLITSGGASVGDHDLVKPALEEWGASLDFWKVAIKPGKPLIVASKGRQVVLGLPGNPVSSFVTAFLFALPLVRQMMGASSPLPRSVTAFAQTGLQAGGKRREFPRATWDAKGVSPLELQDSSALSILSQSYCLIDRPAGALEVPAGEPVTVYPIEFG